MTDRNWEEVMSPLIAHYKDRPHPLAYQNLYQLVVMVILSAQDSDRHINLIAPELFRKYPDMAALALAGEEELSAHIRTVRHFGNKARWLVSLARIVQDDQHIPLTMEALIKLPGIGRKSANVILREAGLPAEGVIVDLHVVRVAPRIGIASGSDPKKIEKHIMEALPEQDWGGAGMAISFLGREICRPSQPQHQHCIVRDHCLYFRTNP
jgi:endonuclease-3